MQRTSIWIESGDVRFIQKQGYTLSGFVREKISELKEDNGNASDRKSPKVGLETHPTKGVKL